MPTDDFVEDFVDQEMERLTDRLSGFSREDAMKVAHNLWEEIAHWAHRECESNGTPIPPGFGQ